MFIFIVAFFGLPIYFYCKGEKQKNEEREQRSKLIDEFIKTYRSFSTSQIEAELEKTDDDYEKVVEQARRVYRERFQDEELFDCLGFDNSLNIRWEIEPLLCARRYAMEDIISKRNQYGDDIYIDNYSICSKIKYKDNEGKTHKVKFTAKIDFAYGYKIAFFYDSDVKKVAVIARMIEHFDIYYDDIKSVEIKNNNLLFKVKNSNYLYDNIATEFNCDSKEKDDYWYFELETDTPVEIKAIIDRIIQGVNEED